MNKVKRLLQSELFILFLSGALIHTAFVAVVLSIYQGAPEILLDSDLAAIIEIFEG